MSESVPLDPVLLPCIVSIHPSILTLYLSTLQHTLITTTTTTTQSCSAPLFLLSVLPCKLSKSASSPAASPPANQPAPPAYPQVPELALCPVPAARSLLVPPIYHPQPVSSSIPLPSFSPFSLSILIPAHKDIVVAQKGPVIAFY